MKFQELPENPYLYLPSESKSWKWVIQLHRRGKSCHYDLRLQVTQDLLVGWTLNTVGVKEVHKSIAETEKQAYKAFAKFYPKFLDPNSKVVCETKSVEPAEWLFVNSLFPEGSVGASRFKTGSMIICDHGTVEFLANKVYFHEYYLHGKYLNGRLTVRQLPNVWKKKSIAAGEASKTGRGYAVWMASFSNPEPYVLSRRAMDNKWYPPEGYSSLPKYVRDQIPTELQYWKLKGKKAQQARDQLIESKKAKQVVLKFADSELSPVFFAYSRACFRGQHVIRSGCSTLKYHLFFSLPAHTGEGLLHFQLDDDILHSDRTMAYEVVCPDKKALDRGVEGEDKAYLEPNSRNWWNPTKNTPLFYTRLDFGKTVVLINKLNFKKFLLKGKKLNGLFIFIREGDSSIFTCKRSAGPGEKLVKIV